jgi:uncharacterized protein YbbC (DUF1343 family)
MTPFMRWLPFAAFWLSVLAAGCSAKTYPVRPPDTVDLAPPVMVGAENLLEWLPLVEGRQVGLVVNHSSLVGPSHLVDTLVERGVCITRIFAPEHGLRGLAEAGEQVVDGADARTGIPIVSLYGKVKKPLPEMLASVDLVIFDIQDVGARFYTYISTLFYVLEACAENGVPVMVLDRPNPNGHYVDGPVLNMRQSSFIGIAPLPIVHGCTVGELARLFKGEYWLNRAEDLDLTVVPCRNYSHRRPYPLPVRPSPNLPDMRSVLLYPSLCLFEGTAASVGRGTETPFQVVGHPAFPDSSFSFVPRPNAGSRYPVLQDQRCFGLDLRALPVDTLHHRSYLDLRYLLEFYDRFPDKSRFFLSNGFFDLLAGTPSLRQWIEMGCTEAEIVAQWQWDLGFFRDIRRKYLLYPE